MGAKPNEKQITVFIDEKERDQFQNLCKTMGWSVSGVIRGWIQSALEEQSIQVPTDGASATPPAVAQPVTNPVDTTVFKEVLHRLDNLERTLPDFDIDDLERMKKELLDGKFGSMRHRMGVVEAQVEALGGSIAWQDATTNADKKSKK